MSKFMDSMEKGLMPIASKISENRYLLAIRDGFMVAMPLLIVGAMSLLLSSLPIPGYTEFMTNIFGENWSTFFVRPFEASIAIMTIFVIFGTANSLAKNYDLEGLSSAAIALVAFLILTPFTYNFTPEGSQEVFEIGSVVPTEWIGSKGLFVGLLTAILSVEIIKYVTNKGWVIRMPKGVPSAVEKAFSSFIPATIVILVFNIIRLIFTLTPFGTIHEFIYKILQVPLTKLGATLGATLFVNFLIGLFWSFGIHGTNIVGAVMTPIWMSLSAENLAAFQAGEPLPHIINLQFQNFLHLGGGGATLSLCIAMVLFSKSEQCKKLGQLSIIPGIFNINEPVIFGLPIVLNPIMMIPFILVPLIFTVLTYIVISLGIVPRTSGVLIPWTTPPVIGGFLVSGIKGAIFQLVELIIGVFIYLPFLKVIDRQYYKQENEIEVKEI